MVLGSTSMWEGGNIYGVFSLCMERTSMSHMCSLLLGKIPFNPLFCPCVLTHMMVVGPSLYEREKTCMVYFFHVWSPPECHACALYYWERLPSIHYFVLMCFTHMTIMGSTFIWERGNMHSVFSPYMEPIQCHVLFTIGKDSLQSIVLSLCALLTWWLWGPLLCEREEICTVYSVHAWSPLSVMYPLLLGKIPFNLSFCICMFYSHCICMWLLFLSFLLKIWTLILIFYTLQVLIFMEWLLHQRYAVVHVTSLLSQKRFFFFFWLRIHEKIPFIKK